MSIGIIGLLFSTFFLSPFRFVSDEIQSLKEIEIAHAVDLENIDAIATFVQHLPIQGELDLEAPFILRSLSKSVSPYPRFSKDKLTIKTCIRCIEIKKDKSDNFHYLIELESLAESKKFKNNLNKKRYLILHSNKKDKKVDI